MGTITRSSEHSWTIELATKRWTFESEEACKFCVMGFEEGTGRPPRTMTLMQFLTLHAPDEHAEAFKLGKDLGESFVQSHHGDETRPGLTKDAEVSRPPNPFFEVHVEIDGKKGGLVFELEGNKEEVDEVLQTADYAVKRMAENASETPQEFAKTVLRTLPSVASRKDDADPQRLMRFAALYMIKTSPKWRPDRMIRNCSLWLHDDQVDVYITYIDHPE